MQAIPISIVDLSAMYLKFLHATLAVVCVQDGLSLKTLIFSCDMIGGDNEPLKETEMIAEQTKCVDKLVQGIEAAGVHCSLTKVTGLKLDTAEQNRIDAALNSQEVIDWHYRIEQNRIDELGSQSQEVIDWLQKEENGETNWRDVLVKHPRVLLLGLLVCVCVVVSAVLSNAEEGSADDQNEKVTLGPYSAIMDVCPASAEMAQMQTAFIDLWVNHSQLFWLDMLTSNPYL
jgi:hypothetical protein